MLAADAIGNAFQMDICAHDRLRGFSHSADFTDADRGYVLHSRSGHPGSGGASGK